MSHSVVDFIIVGAGSAGCVLADRLSADGRFQVLVLEAGGSDWNPFVHMPAGLAQLTKFKSLNWNYHTEPQAQLNNRSLYWPRGKLLGGSSSINAMCYIRGHASDYDHWGELGNASWSYKDVLPYFIRSENQERGADAFHGTGGPLNVADLRHTNVLSHAFVEAAQQAKFPPQKDFNGAEQEGFGFYQVTQKDGKRCSTAAGYLKRAMARGNVEVITNAQVMGLTWEGTRVTGVSYRKSGALRTATAAREVLLSGGAINSPQLLMLSGVGQPDQLRQHGIAARVDLPGVGQNLQDHLDVCTLMLAKEKITYDTASDFKIGLEYLLTGGGIGSSNIAETGGFARSALAKGRPDLQFHFVPALLEDHGRVRVNDYGFTLHCCPLRPESRGEVTLHSNDPAAPARLQPNYLSADADLELMLEGLRLSAEILSQPALSQHTRGAYAPAANQTSRAQLIEFIRQKAETIYHPVGTCKMGHDDMAVVDAQLCVYGTQGLRVIDASIMPTLIGGNTNAPTVMIAEKASDLILGR